MGKKSEKNILKKASKRGVPEKNTYLKAIERQAFGIESDNEIPYVTLKYYYPNYECFSAWSKDELSAFSDFTEKLKKIKWKEIYKSGGSVGCKTGFGYTPHRDKNKLPKHPELNNLSEDITFFELRITEKARVHGFRIKDAFFLVFLDREHRVYQM